MTSIRATLALTVLVTLAGAGCDALQDRVPLDKEGAPPPGEPSPKASPDAAAPSDECGTDADCGPDRVCNFDAGICRGPSNCDPTQGCPTICMLVGTCEPKKAPPPKGEPCGAKTCDAGMVCCNDSCGICTPPGGACILLECQPAAECRTDVDCTTHESVCGGMCSCEALPRSGPSTECQGPVACFVDPCLNSKAVCKAGQCVLATPEPASECATDADCRTYESHCGECGCRALSPRDAIPACAADSVVQCFAAPCLGKTAACKGGQCVISLPGAPAKCDARTQGGPTSCKPADVWKTYASDDCARSGLVLSDITLRVACDGGNSRFVDYVCCSR